MDIVDSKTRSRMMAAVRGSNTQGEIAIRKRLFFKGFRYRINVKSLPGTPDIVLKKYRVVIMINGCFWHYHGCSLSRLPKSRSEWWTEKLRANRSRDARHIGDLVSAGWRVLIIWECAFRRSGIQINTGFDLVSAIAADFIHSSQGFLEICSGTDFLFVSDKKKD